jgi:hypothetical protein
MPIRTLAEAISHYGRAAYLLTVAKNGPHTSNVTIELRNGSIGCNVGAVRVPSPTTATARAHPTVTA